MRLLVAIVPLVFVLLSGAVSVQAATNVTLVSPSNGNVSYVTSGEANYSFNCSASDSVQLANMSLWVNSTGTWHQNQTANVTGIWNFSIFNLSLGPGFYVWNCLAGDNSSNYEFSPENWTVLVSNVSDAVLPNVTLVLPGDGNQSSTTTYVNYTFNCSASDDVQLANMSLWVNSTGTWHQNQTANVTGIWNFSIFNLSLGPGFYVWNCLAGDNSSNYEFASANRTISISAADITPPDIWLDPPTPDNQSNRSINWIYVNVSANEDLDTCLLNWYNGSWQNVSMNVSGSVAWINMTDLQDGSYYFRVYANDSAGNWNVTGDRQVNVDASYPLISITSPLNGTNYSSASLYLNFTCNEPNPHTCWYDYNGSNNTLANCTGANFTGLDHQESFLFVWMNDTAGNTNVSGIVFSVCTESWSCSAWSTCSGGMRTRACTDLYTCGTVISRPVLSELCETPGGGGGGGGAAEEKPEIVKSWDRIFSGIQVTLAIARTGLDFTEIRMKVMRDVWGVTMTVTKLDNAAAGTGQAPGNLYQYVNVTAPGLKEDNLDYARISFRISRSWMYQNSIGNADVYLSRYVNGSGWKSLNTTFQGEDILYAYFQADTPGFSYFAITAAIPQSPSVPVKSPESACNNTICEPGENETSCPADCMLLKQCEAGMFMCHGNTLEGCRDGGWVIYRECESGCMGGRCLEAAPVIPSIDAAIIIIVSGALAIVVELILWRKKFSPWRYFRI